MDFSDLFGDMDFDMNSLKGVPSRPIPDTPRGREFKPTILALEECMRLTAEAQRQARRTTKNSRKRLEILKRFDFHCEDCGSGEITLNVHHSYYERGLKPWEYPDESLHALCEGCHIQHQDGMTELHRAIGQLPLGEVETLRGYIAGMLSHLDVGAPIVVLNYPFAAGLADAFNLTPEEVIDTLNERVTDAATLVVKLAKKQRALGLDHEWNPRKPEPAKQEEG